MKPATGSISKDTVASFVAYVATREPMIIHSSELRKRALDHGGPERFERCHIHGEIEPDGSRDVVGGPCRRRVSELTGDRDEFGDEVTDTANGRVSQRCQQVQPGPVCRRADRRAHTRGPVQQVLEGGAVLCLPTGPFPAPPLGEPMSRKSQELRPRIFALTCIAGLWGAPQITLPAGEVEGLPVGLSLLGPRGSDETLIGIAQEWEAGHNEQR